MIYRPDIDGLRAVAVLPVVLYHAGVPGPSGGFLGVDVFFVISGYLITAIIAREIAQGTFSLASFYERRARRILPALSGVVVFCFVAGWYVLFPAELQSLGHSALATALFASNVYFFFELDYFARAAEFAPLLHTWSLAVEEQFYLFFPLLLMALGSRSGQFAALWVVAGLSVLSLVAAVLVLPRQADLVFYLIFFRAWELGAGALLALAALKAPRGRWLRETLALTAILAILVPVFVYDASTPFPGLAALPPVAGATVLIWVGAAGGGSLVTSMLALRGPVWIGLISYSLYLWHWPILAFLRIARESATLPLSLGLGAVALSVLMAAASYRFIEQPFRKRPPQGFGRGQIFAGSLAVIAGIALAGGLAHVSQGAPGRLSPAVVSLADGARDGNPRQQACFDIPVPEGLCQIGVQTTDPAPAEFLFWGDSHANSIMPGMDLAAATAGKSGFFAGRSACLPVLSVQRATRGAPCTQFNEDVWAWLAAHPDVSTVVLLARWPLSVEGTRFRNEAGRGFGLTWIGAPEQRPDAADNASLVEAGLRETVRRILETGRDVVLVGPVPEIGRNVPAAAARAELLGWDLDASLSTAQFTERAGRSDRILARVAAAHDRVRYMPVSDLFCDAQTCRTIGPDGQPLYVDDNHVSRTTARQVLAPRFEQIWR